MLKKNRLYLVIKFEVLSLLDLSQALVSLPRLLDAGPPSARSLKPHPLK